ncbi:MAG: cupin domain-containing protein [Christensenellaceae bacterium]|nr:cupin domain-containing protein [Christensenellaceae bacterium]
MKILHENVAGLPAEHKSEHPGYDCLKKAFVQRGGSENMKAAFYELAPGKAAYPYHYHTQNEELFFILSGQGTLRTPAGERQVAAGDLIFFPAGEEGAHKLTNTGEEPLTYLDVDVAHKVDVAVYPDSGKVGIWGGGIRKVFALADEKDYYDGE